MFKLGKINTSVQIYQVKSASMLQFRKMEESVLQNDNSSKQIREKTFRSKTPHFGPIKGFKNSP